mmetsp:Transcript_29181/g.73399  ORF Transcript_29181/g.73399 Transcript_29181/m.73399 type:complete len:258 (+) Transcript_29181:267-1040(+)
MGSVNDVHIVQSDELGDQGFLPGLTTISGVQHQTETEDTIRVGSTTDSKAKCLVVHLHLEKETSRNGVHRDPGLTTIGGLVHECDRETLHNDLTSDETDVGVHKLHGGDGHTGGVGDTGFVDQRLPGVATVGGAHQHRTEGFVERDRVGRRLNCSMLLASFGQLALQLGRVVGHLGLSVVHTAVTHLTAMSHLVDGVTLRVVGRGSRQLSTAHVGRVAVHPASTVRRQIAEWPRSKAPGTSTVRAAGHTVRDHTLVV